MSLLLTWYGDDFTGSGAVLEALEFAGLPSVLFLGVPDAGLQARFAGRRAVARTPTTVWPPTVVVLN